jgi:flagellin
MAMIINTNIASLNAQNNLNRSQNSLAASLQRLSSGLRINSARDDAAGLAIVNRMSAQIAGMNQAARNANDAISLTQTADGSFASITSNLQRMRELAVQAANSTNSSTDRAALQQEVNQLASEIDRVAVNSQFNGINLLDGTFTNRTFQLGANSGQSITLSSIISARSSALGASYSTSVTSTAVTTVLAAGDLTLNGVAIGASAAGSLNGQDSDSAWAIAQAINTVSGAGVTAAANSTVVTGAAPAANGAIAANTFQINGVNVGAIADGGTVAGQGTNVAAAINLISAATGVTATAAAGGAVTLTALDGRNITIGGTITNTGLTAATTSATITLSSSSTSGITVGGNHPAYAGLTAGSTAATLSGTAISSVDISSAAGAATALISIDAALSSVNSERAKIGAYANRFASAVESLQTTSENLSASRSRIQDTDFAVETAQMTRDQILQQAGVSILSQANQAPQLALKLLQ